MTLKQAVKKLTLSLKKDPGYFNGWQANIAMSFVDEFERMAKIDNEDILDEEQARRKLHEIANQAAKNFLNLLCRET